jgi:hypothetical protein
MTMFQSLYYNIRTSIVLLSARRQVVPLDSYIQGSGTREILYAVIILGAHCWYFSFVLIVLNTARNQNRGTADSPPATH